MSERQSLILAERRLRRGAEREAFAVACDSFALGAPCETAALVTFSPSNARLLDRSLNKRRATLFGQHVRFASSRRSTEPSMGATAALWRTVEGTICACRIDSIANMD
jgi:hypothetical protein